MQTYYSMNGAKEASYEVAQNGDVTVTVRSREILKPRAIYYGAATMEFMWVSSGKGGSHWQFIPTVLSRQPAQYTSEMDGQDQVFKIAIGKNMFPASGLIRSNVAGQILAPGIQFDLPHATDLWVFILRSPWTPVIVNAGKMALSISHGSAQALAQIEGGNGSAGEQSLHVYATVHGEGFKRVWLELERKTNHANMGEIVGEVQNGIGTFTWKPRTGTFDVVLVTSSSVSINSFIDFLKTLGAEGSTGLFAYLHEDLVLSDGSSIQYILSLKGQKLFLGTEEDRTQLKLS